MLITLWGQRADFITFYLVAASIARTFGAELLLWESKSAKL